MELGPPLVEGIYLDSFCNGVNIFSNIVCRCSYAGIYLHGTRDNWVQNNIIVNCTNKEILFYGALTNSSTWTTSYSSLLAGWSSVINQPAWASMRGMSVSPAINWPGGYTMGGNVFTTNIAYYVNPGGNATYFAEYDDLMLSSNVANYSSNVANYNTVYCFGSTVWDVASPGGSYNWATWQGLGYDRSSVVADPLFNNPSLDDYALATTSPALAMGFQQITTNNMGPYNDPLRATWPIGDDETPPPGTVQFKSSTYSIGEAGGSVRLYVSRSGGSSGAASVSYATANGTATAGSDYTAVSGTLNWADGDAADKYFDVPILNDSVYEGNETLTASLSGASGATLGSPATTTVTIVDDEPPPPAGLVAYWPLEEGSGSTTADASGGGRPGTLSGGTAWTAGRVGSGAVAFDGVNGRMTFTALPLTNTFTVALWIYPVPSSASYGTLFAQDASKGIWYRGASRVIEFYGTSQTSQTAISENQWHHVAVVCNAGQVTYYLDGVADGTATGGIGFNADNMGDDPGSETFKGGVDEVRVYNGALSAAQVAALASPPPPAGLVAYWPLEEGSGSTTADASGGGRPGTLSGGTAWTAGWVGSGAVAFDGVNGRMTFTALPLTNTFTVALWIYPVPSSASYGTLFAQDASKGIWYRGASRVIEFYGTSQTSQTAISENQWHHVAVVCNAGQVTYYLDGVADGTATGGTGFNADNMGDDPGSETFKGGVDEVRVYNGALSAAQVAALASPPPPAGLVAYLAAGGRLGLHDRRRLGRGPAGHAERRDRLDGGLGGQRGHCL